MKLTTEYLIVVERTTAEALYNLCSSTEDLLRLLRTEPSVDARPAQIVYREQYAFLCQIRTSEIAEKKQRFFYLKVQYEGVDEDIDAYSDLLRVVRKLVGGAGGHIETLWDDVSLHYSKMCYPLIHASESLLRKLIAYFMLTTIGKEWVNETSPAAFRDAVAKSKRRQYVDVLHQVDFIQLGDFLFRAYSTKDPVAVLTALSTANKVGDVSVDALKECIPRSNWERYFSRIVECTNEHLDKAWKELYELRCIVAHNALVSKQDYERIRVLTTDINKYLQKAVDNLHEVHVSDEDRDAVAEQAVVSISGNWGEFLSLWRTLETEILLIKDADGAEKPESFARAVASLSGDEIIDAKTRDLIFTIQEVRNKLVHGASEPPAEHVLAESIALLRDVLATLNPPQRWKDRIARAIRAKGGVATLAEIYSHIEDHVSTEMTENWKAIVRYTLQLNSSDTATFRRGGGEDMFRHVGPGRWALRDFEGDAAQQALSD